MDDYRKKALEVYKIMENAKAKREEIVNSGLTDKKMTEMLQDLRAEATFKVKELNEELHELASFDVIAAAEEEDKARRKGRDPQLMVYHQNRARANFDGYTEEELLRKYPDIAGTLQDDEKPYLYVYEDDLKARLRDAVDLDPVLFKHKSVEEKLTIAHKARVANFMNHDKTIRGLIETEVDSVLKGENPAGHDFANLLDEMKA